MCWNKEVSFLTFAIGTVFTILLWTMYNDSTIRSIALLWQFVLCMQIFEGLSWISKETQNEPLSHFSTYGAFIFNILQPVFISICALILTSDTTMRITISCFLLLYLVSIGWSIFSLDKPLFEHVDTCNHLQLYWWSSFSSFVFPLYLILLGLGCATFKPFSLGMIQYGYILVTLVLSAWIYPCTYGSMWCWFAAFAPILTFIYLKATNVTPEPV